MAWGRDDNEVRTGNATILDAYGNVLAETWSGEDIMISADLDLSMIPQSTGRRWIKSRRPDLYKMLTEKTGLEKDTRTVRFE